MQPINEFLWLILMILLFAMLILSLILFVHAVYEIIRLVF